MKIILWLLLKNYNLTMDEFIHIINNCQTSGETFEGKYLTIGEKMVGDDKPRQKGPKENEPAKKNPFLQDCKSINSENSSQQMSRIYYPFTNTNNIFR